MRIKWIAAMAAMCLATAASSAFADTVVTLNFTGATGPTEPLTGGTSAYVYPYDFTINGSSATLMCISFNNEIVTPESWTATASQLSASSSSFDKEEAYLFSLITPSTSSATVANIQFADWYLSDAANNYADVEATTFYKDNTAAITGYVGQAEGTTPGLGLDESASFYSQFELYTPNHPASYYTTANGYPDGVPQSFIGAAPTPEPGSLALLGTGLLGMGGVIRRRMQKA